MNILVTGACGFIGSNLCQSLLADGHSITGVDAFTDNYSVKIKQLNQKKLESFKNFTLLYENLLSTNLERVLDKTEVVFHLAGQPSVQNSWGTSLNLYLDRNILLTQKLLDTAVKLKIKKFIYASSSSVYGQAMPGLTNEKDEKNPISPYGVTKLAAENLVTLFGSEFGLNTISLRYFTVYGPRQRPDMAFHRIIQSINEDEIFYMHGDGSQTRDFTFIEDVVTANKLAAHTEVAPGSVFNIGGGSPITMIKSISIIESLMQKELKVEHIPSIHGNPFITRSDCTKANIELNWKPKVSIIDGLKAQIDWQTKTI